MDPIRHVEGRAVRAADPGIEQQPHRRPRIGQRHRIGPQVAQAYARARGQRMGPAAPAAVRIRQPARCVDLFGPVEQAEPEKGRIRFGRRGPQRRESVLKRMARFIGEEPRRLMAAQPGKAATHIGEIARLNNLQRLREQERAAAGPRVVEQHEGARTVEARKGRSDGHPSLPARDGAIGASLSEPCACIAGGACPSGRA